MKIEMVEKVYYWNCRLGGQTALLAGPFLTAAEAEATANVVGPLCVEERPETQRATFGVMECRAPGMGEGRYNHKLPYDMLRNLAIDTGIRSQ